MADEKAKVSKTTSFGLSSVNLSNGFAQSLVYLRSALIDFCKSSHGASSYMLTLSCMTQEERAFTEKKLRELAIMVERQENGRQTLLAEVTSDALMFPLFNDKS